jgi:hypothetical protein
MKANMFSALLVITIMGLAVSGCKPAVDPSPGRACFALYTINENGTKADNVTTVKVGQVVGADISCADPCQHNILLDWGEGTKGTQLTYKYNTPGTYTVTYECSTMSSKAQRHAKKNKHRTRVHRYQSLKVITVAQ